MRAPRSFAFALALTTLVPAVAQAFCGFYVSGADAQIFNNATQVVLLRDGTTTVMSMQNDYEGPASRFAMVVPVPVVLQKDNVKTLPREIFSRLDSLAAPRLVEYWEQDPCRQLRMRAEAMMGGGLPSMSVRMSASKKKGLGVTVEAQFTVGEYEIVILSAKDSGGLEEWLRQEGYTIPKGAEPYLRPYVQQGSKFFVAKVDVTKVKFEGNRAVLSPLRFNYQSKDFKLPVRLGMMNSQGTQDLIVHILAKNQRYEVSNRPNATIPTNLNLKEAARGRFGEFYAALFDRVVAANKGAVVTEYAWDSNTCDPCPVPALRYSELLTLGLDVIEGAPLPPSGPPPAPLGATPTKPQIPPPLKTTGKKGDIVNELMAAPVAPTKTGGIATPPPQIKRKRRRIRGGARGWVLTRLHARYEKDGLEDDLVFKTAPPIAGGRERYVGQDRSLPEQGARPDSRNNFQGRYAIRHEWQGAIECENPRRGVWGGPPNGGRPKPLAAKDTAMAPRGKIALASMVARGLSKELMAAPDPPIETGAETKPVGATGGGPGSSTTTGKGGAAPPDSVPPLEPNCATLSWGVTRAWPWLHRR